MLFRSAHKKNNQDLEKPSNQIVKVGNTSIQNLKSEIPEISLGNETRYDEGSEILKPKINEPELINYTSNLDNSAIPLIDKSESLENEKSIITNELVGEKTIPNTSPVQEHAQEQNLHTQNNPEITDSQIQRMSENHQEIQKIDPVNNNSINKIEEHNIPEINESKDYSQNNTRFNSTIDETYGETTERLSNDIHSHLTCQECNGARFIELDNSEDYPDEESTVQPCWRCNPNWASDSIDNVITKETSNHKNYSKNNNHSKVTKKIGRAHV